MFGGTNLGNMVHDSNDKWRYIDSAFIVLGRVYILMIIITIIITIISFIILRQNANTKATPCPCQAKSQM